MSGMHLVRRAADIVLAPHPVYHNHSQGYQIASLVDHTSGSVHTGLSMNHVAANGSISPHVHSYEEGFYILEGEADLGNQRSRPTVSAPGDFWSFQSLRHRSRLAQHRQHPAALARHGRTATQTARPRTRHLLPQNSFDAPRRPAAATGSLRRFPNPEYPRSPRCPPRSQQCLPPMDDR